jgi:hypothetical protein
VPGPDPGGVVAFSENHKWSERSRIHFDKLERDRDMLLTDPILSVPMALGRTKTTFRNNGSSPSVGDNNNNNR